MIISSAALTLNFINYHNRKHDNQRMGQRFFNDFINDGTESAKLFYSNRNEDIVLEIFLYINIQSNEWMQNMNNKILGDGMNYKLTEIELNAVGIIQKVLELAPDISNDVMIQLCRGGNIPVYIDRNNDLGHYIYVVVIYGTDYWLDGFKYESDALNFTDGEMLNLINI